MEADKPQERYQRYTEEKRKGGMALSMFDGSSHIAAYPPSVLGQFYLDNEDVIEHFHDFAETMHPQWYAIMCYLTHMGQRTAGSCRQSH